MATDLYIKLPSDFEKRLDDYKARILGVKQPSQAKDEYSENVPTRDNDRPYCVIEGKWGFLKFKKQGKKIKIGLGGSQPFKLLQCLTEPFGTAKMVDTVFEAIRENIKYKSGSGIYTKGIDKQQKIILIKYAIKELQKDNKLQGKLQFKWDDLNTKVWSEYLG